MHLILISHFKWLTDSKYDIRGIHCTTLWRHWLAPYCTFYSCAVGVDVRVSAACHSLCPFVTRGLGGVVDRSFGACPVTCSSRHMTSYLFYSYISTHPLRSQWEPFPLCMLGRSRLRALGSKTTRELLTFRVAIRVC